MGHYTFKLPDVGEGTAEAEIVGWHVKVGDVVAEDQNLVDVMTDKATVEMTSPVSGKVIGLHGDPGQMAAVGSPLVELEVEGAGNIPESPPSVRVGENTQHSDSVALPVLPRPLKLAISPALVDRPLASPALRQRAHELGIALQYVQGSGPGGRITQTDLDAYITSAPRISPLSVYAKREGIEDVKIVGLRRKIAEKMQESKRRIPHYAYVEEIDMTALEHLRTHLNKSKRADQPKLNILPFLIRALVRILPDYPQINACFDDEAGVVHRHAGVHVGIAVQTSNGLIVPVVRHAEVRDIWNIATEITRVAQLTRSGKASREDLSGSTITVTSLGTLGGIVTTPVINHPEVAIIGPNAIVERPVVLSGQIAIRKMMNLSSSFDHRVVDGFDAAEFVQRIKVMVEHPATLFMDCP